MKVDVTDCIIELLHSGKKVGIPGLGNLSVQRVSANIDDGKIHPPYKSIIFSEEIIASDELKDCLLKKYKFTKRTANTVINKFSQILINKLVNFKKVRLPNIGVFNNAGNNGISFEEERNVVNAAKSLLPVFDLNSIIIEEEPSPKAVVPQSTFVKKVEKAPTVQPLTNSNKPAEFNPYKTRSTDEEKSSWTTYLLPLLLLLFIAFLLIFGIKKCTNYIKGAEATLVEANSNEDTVNNSENAIQDENIDVDSNELTFDPDREYELDEFNLIPPSVYENGCVIIVGSFSKNRNALNMINKVKRLGFTSHKSFNSTGMTRVGIKFECNEDNIESFLHEIRNDFDSGSWYLVPNLRID